MKKKIQAFVPVGTSFILVIFVILCMVTFAVLSFISASQDQALAQKKALRIQQYYQADLAARTRLFEIDQQLSTIWKGLPVREETAFLEAARQAFHLEEPILRFIEPISDQQVLQVELAIQPPEAAPAKAAPETLLYPCCRILRWQVVTTADWNPDLSLPVLVEE